MAEIGATLREARMRQRIDITDMELRTKIRAKYLRALENEEWDLLPGPTYVRSFLRTYADALGLDSKLLVEEFKLRHDQLETGELHPIRRPSQRERDRRRQHQPRGLPRSAVVGGVLAVIVALLFVIGQGGNNGSNDPVSGSTTTPTTTQPQESSSQASKPKRKSKPKQHAAAARAIVRLQIIPTAPVAVCLTNINGDVLAGNVTLSPGQPSKTYRSKRFRLVLANSNAQLKINGTVRTIQAAPGPIGFTITKNGRSALPASKRPNCG